MKISFAKLLLKESQEFLKLAKFEKSDKFLREMYIKASIAFAWFGLEGVINLITSDFLVLKNLPLHEKAFIEEKNIEFQEGEFKINGKRYRSTKDKLLYLLKNFGNYNMSQKGILWNKLNNLEEMRNALVHPKGSPSIKKFKEKNAEEGLKTVISIIEILYKKIYKKDIRL